MEAEKNFAADKEYAANKEYAVKKKCGAKKFYAVKKGKITGVFSSWPECKSSVDGYAGAEYKGFATLEEAEEYLSGVGAAKSVGCKTGAEGCGSKSGACKGVTRNASDLPQSGTLLAYVDGSFDSALQKYAFGCVFILPDGRIYTEYGNGDNEESLKLHNVTGEMLGAMFAAMLAIKNRFEMLEIRYDYQGIEKWVTGEWKAKTDLTKKYAEAMRGWSKVLSIKFTKVAAHSNVTYNELADKLAKTGLTRGNGVPKTRLFEEMEQYDGTDSFE